MLHPGPSSCLQAFGHQAITVPADRHPVGDPAHERTVGADVSEGEQQPLTVIAALQKSPMCSAFRTRFSIFGRRSQPA